MSSQPWLILFDGQIYELTNVKPGVKKRKDQYLHVVKTSNEYDDADDDEEEITRRGPSEIVYRDAVFKVTSNDPAMVSDDVARVVVALPARLPTTLPVAQVTIPRLSSAMPTLPSAPVDPAVTTYWNNLLRGPRTGKVIQLLPMGFDLPLHIRNNTQYTVPPVHKPDPCPHVRTHNGPKCGCIKRRATWHNSNHISALWDLVEGATKFLNREVSFRDFPAIVEAMNRKFENTSQPCPLRGSAGVHTYIAKKDTRNYFILKTVTDRALAALIS